MPSRKTRPGFAWGAFAGFALYFALLCYGEGVSPSLVFALFPSMVVFLVPTNHFQSMLPDLLQMAIAYSGIGLMYGSIGVWVFRWVKLMRNPEKGVEAWT